MRLSRLGKIDRALGAGSQRGFIDIEARDLAAQHGIVEPPRRIGADEQGRLDDPVLRTQIASFDVDEAALAAAAERMVDLAKAGRAHPAFSSAMKYYGTELNKRRYEILMSAGGIDALEWESERSRGGARPRAWLRTKANSIEGGTSEVMLGIVAKRILDLPGA